VAFGGSGGSRDSGVPWWRVLWNSGESGVLWVRVVTVVCCGANVRVVLEDSGESGVLLWGVGGTVGHCPHCTHHGHHSTSLLPCHHTITGLSPLSPHTLTSQRCVVVTVMCCGGMTVVSCGDSDVLWWPWDSGVRWQW
jgi:hypothetical protein